ncbi:MAG TPA: bacitracin ABC transporter ATP-binding protein [Bacillus sp. (in: firmicutes)]|jgi:hypothetical protein
MIKEKKPLMSDEFLDELAELINQQYGGPSPETNDELTINEND